MVKYNQLQGQISVNLLQLVNIFRAKQSPKRHSHFYLLSLCFLSNKSLQHRGLTDGSPSYLRQEHLDRATLGSTHRGDDQNCKFAYECLAVAALKYRDDAELYEPVCLL